MKRIIWSIFGENSTELKYSYWINSGLFLLIILNIFAVIISTVNTLSQNIQSFLIIFEYFSVLIFIIEWMLKCYSSNLKYPNRLKYILSIDSIIDLCSILPTILIFIPFDGRIIRGLRLFRIIRFAKMSKYTNAISSFVMLFNRKKEELILSFSFILIILILLSCVMYYIEYPSQPEIFSDIPSTMWWSITTLTTVGYGDMYPITILGKVIAGCISFLGIGIFAIPAGIVSSGFIENISDKKTCPHCQQNLGDNRYE